MFVLSAAPAGWSTSASSPAVNSPTKMFSNSPSRLGKSRSTSSTGSGERYRSRTDLRSAGSRRFDSGLCPQCFLEMDKAEDAEKMAESCKADPPKLAGKRLMVYVSRKYRQLKHG